MEKENKAILYLHMILATLGTIIILLTAILNTKNNNYYETPLILFGASLIFGYINFLEKKAGINNKLTWARVIVSLIGMLILYFLLK
ncbi:hypothetical protein [Bacillus sp. S/N-304-OC-R1]|uniref:hypothetical protein n=1 Tax=Bacillus sp. S/N-304-OC-R1 TaxID=2758034 RepID=UPI001C8D494C|nr:hypothetical protein [Bacillus sp. S/N-304-OC-R1]MBY0121574.1 hypothetical protein [Bacillus sp. S/N-304-OC-R1]